MFLLKVSPTADTVILYFISGLESLPNAWNYPSNLSNFIQDSYDGPPGFRFFTQALHYLPELHIEEPSTLFVSTLALVGYYMQNLNRRDAAYLYVGTA
jgi:hypothetical protein